VCFVRARACMHAWAHACSAVCVSACVCACRAHVCAVYVGLSPYEAPATFSLLAYTELCDGVWYAMGGLHTVPQSLARIATKLGAAVRYGAAVRGVRTDGARVCCVELEGGETIDADVVVASADLPYPMPCPRPCCALPTRLLPARRSRASTHAPAHRGALPAASGALWCTTSGTVRRGRVQACAGTCMRSCCRHRPPPMLSRKSGTRRRWSRSRARTRTDAHVRTRAYARAHARRYSSSTITFLWALDRPFQQSAARSHPARGASGGTCASDCPAQRKHTAGPSPQDAGRALFL
jgi:hypothetical protein